jgi:hypothetical protein
MIATPSLERGYTWPPPVIDPGIAADAAEFLRDSM